MNLKKLAIATLVGSIGLSVLSLSLSFAWYNTSENLYLDTLVISVSGEQTILISTKPDINSFKEEVKFHYDEEDNDLENKGVFQPVSSMFKSNWLEDDLKTEPEFYFYSSPSVDINNEPIYETPDWGYYSQHLYLYSRSNIKATVDSEDFKLQALERFNYNYAYELSNYEHIQFEYSESHPDWTKEQIREDLKKGLDDLVKCMRVGLLDISENQFYIIDPYKDGNTVLGGRADLFLDDGGYYDYYNDYGNNESYEIIYGEVTDREKAVYKVARAEDTDAPEEYNSFNACTKAGVRAFDYEASVANGMNIAIEDSLSLEEIEDDIILELKGGEPKEIIFMIYMEGWDRDCTNKHMGAGFDLDMKFKVSEKEQ